MVKSGRREAEIQAVIELHRRDTMNQTTLTQTTARLAEMVAASHKDERALHQAYLRELAVRNQPAHPVSALASIASYAHTHTQWCVC